MTARTLRILRSHPCWESTLALALALDAIHARAWFYDDMTATEIRWFGGCP